MNLLSFIQNFPDEESCIAHFKAQRDQIGLVCTRFGSKEHIWLNGKLRYECKHCHHRQSIRTDTVLECTKEIVKEQIDSTAELTTDDSKTFYKLKQVVESHKAQVIEPEDLQKILPCVHIRIENENACCSICTTN